jgi:hypothetical protein
MIRGALSGVAYFLHAENVLANMRMGGCMAVAPINGTANPASDSAFDRRSGNRAIVALAMGPSEA